MAEPKPSQICNTCCGPCCTRESFIGKETMWTGWHKRPPPRDPKDRRDRCALLCAVDPERKREDMAIGRDKPCMPKSFVLPSGVTVCQDPSYPEDEDPSLAIIKRKLNEGKEDVTKNDIRYANTAVGLVGRRRETMLENRLLHRHQIGQQIKCCREMPCEDFVYGITSSSGWKAEDALRGWAGTGLKTAKQQRIKKKPENLCCTDILALNRAAVGSGIATVSEFRNYRNMHCLSFSRLARRGGERLPPLAPDKDRVYGRKSNFVTNMKELMSDQELKDWQICVRNCLKEKVTVKKQNKPDPWKENTACVMRACNAVKGPQTESLWRMPRFENKAKPHLCTFRSDTALTAAHKANSLESVAREGIWGQGVNTKVVNTMDHIYPFKA